MNSLVTIVVPIYNVQAYLKKCVDSLINQKYKKIEIILVDDASPDECPRIADEYAAKDSRVKVIHKKNGGLSDARNAGIQAARGEYIAFVDGDDFVSSSYVSRLLKACEDSGADISSSGFYKVYGKKKVPVLKGVHGREFTGLEAIEDIFIANSINEVMTWNKLYRRSLFIKHSIGFPVGKLHEDNFTTYKLFFYANKTVYVDEPLYYYIQRTDSIMGQSFNARRLDILDVPKEVEDFLTKHAVVMGGAVQAMRVLTVLGVYNDYLMSRKKDKKVEKTIKVAVREIGNVSRNELISLKQKILVCLVRYVPLVYVQLRRLYETRNRRKILL